MEQRCSIRNSIQHSVVVDCPGLGLTPANIYDISLVGMFIQTDGLKFPLEALVFVVFDPSPGTQRDGFGLEAMVVRHTPSGVGLMFLEMETKIVRALRLMWSSTPAFAPALPAQHLV